MLDDQQRSRHLQRSTLSTWARCLCLGTQIRPDCLAQTQTPNFQRPQEPQAKYLPTTSQQVSERCSSTFLFPKPIPYHSHSFGLLLGWEHAVYLLWSTRAGETGGSSSQAAPLSLALHCQESARQRPPADKGVSRWC